MAGQANIEAQATLVPRHYVLGLQAVLDPTAMLELATSLDLLHASAANLFGEEVAGGFFAKLREAVDETYKGDRPQPIVVPDVLPEERKDDDGTGGVPAKV